MITHVPLAGLGLAAALAGTGLSPAAATAVPPPGPGYECQRLYGGQGDWSGRTCSAFNGAPTHGAIYGTFTITGEYQGAGTTVTCPAPATGRSGVADIPAGVTASHCM